MNVGMNCWTLLVLALACWPMSAAAQVDLFEDVLDRFMDARTSWSTAQERQDRNRLADLCSRPVLVSHDIRILDPVPLVEFPSASDPDGRLTGIDKNHLNGLAVMTYGFRLDVEYRRHDGGVWSCMHVESVHVVSGTKAPGVWLSQGLDPCERRQTLIHEVRHVLNYHDHLNRFRDAIDRELALRLGDVSWTWLDLDDRNAGANARSRLEDRVVSLASDIHGRSERRASKLDELLDRPEAYRATYAPCWQVGAKGRS